MAKRKTNVSELDAGTPLLSVRIPGLPPTVNSNLRYTAKRVYKPAKIRDWQAAVAVTLSALRRTKQVHAGPACYLLILLTGTARRMDCDNREKALQDCLETSGVLQDDSQIVDHRTVRIITGREDETALWVWAGDMLPEDAARIIEEERRG